VTDADIVLGYIPVDFFLGGTIPLDVELAKNAIEKNIAKPLGLDIIAAAHSIAALVEDNMAQGIFLSAVERGLDPRDFTLVAGGGAGPVHAAAIASRLGITQIYVPRQAAAFCALGAALANYEYVLNLCIYRSEDQLHVDELKGWYRTLEDEGLDLQSVLDVYQESLTEALEQGLKSVTDFVRIAGRWFPRALLVDINIGHLNLAEAVLDMAGGGPLPTSALLEQIELPVDVNPKLLEFSLDLALQRFLERVDRILVTSPNYLEFSQVLHPFRAKCRIVPLGIDTSMFHPTSEILKAAETAEQA
jgi:hypothetical protein